MKKLKALLYSTALVALVAIAPESYAQCDFNTKHCNLDLGEFKSNGQFSFAALGPGETAELSLVFYRGLDYKVLVCGNKKLETLEFKIISSNEEILFDNRDHADIQDWDFTMTATQRLRLEVKVPGYAFDGDKTKKGCVIVMIGHRESEAKQESNK